MKNLTKIFMAVVVAMAAYACASDPTDDLGVQLGNEGQTTISLSLEDGRTHIQGKVGDEYPLYWSEGDKIAVNGETSAPLAESDHGQKTATFTVGGTPDYPRTIVYPAPADGVTASAEGYYPVTFLATQNYTPGTFAEGAAPMYSYQATNADAAVLQHLAGVLRIAPKGNGEILKALVVSAEGGKIAGNFDLAADGTLTPHADAVNIVTVNFGENGLALGAEATPIYVAVPKGEYGLVSVTLYTATSYMTLCFSSEGVGENGEPKAVKAGKVREFPEFTYKANGEDDGSFLIYDEVTLRDFAANVAEITSAKVVANVDMTGKAWTPINNENHFVLDGGDFTIKGLSAPLFGTTASSIKNLKLENVNITETTANVALGALARVINHAEAVVENCSATGNMVVEHSAAASADTYVAGLVAKSISEQTFTELTNEINIEVKGNKYAQKLYLTGCVGSASTTNLTNTTNLGNIKFSGHTTAAVYLSGVLQKCKDCDNCVNGSEEDSARGAIDFVGEGTTVTVGGVADTHIGAFANAKNYGTITFGGTMTGTIHIGGIVRVLNSTASNCKNYGAINFAADAAGKSPIMGGIAPNSTSSRSYENCENWGALTVTSSATVLTVAIGGIAGDTTAPNTVTITFDGCSNHGPITFEGTATGDVRAAGLVSRINQKNSTSHKIKVLNGFTNASTGTITIKGSSKTVQIAGLVGNMSSTLSTESTGVIKNEAAIKFEGTASGGVRVGGIVAAAIANTFGSDTYSLVNTGDLTASGTTTDSTYTVGGIYGNNNRVVKNARCYCNIVAASTCSGAGMIYGDDKSSTALNAHIGGTISKDGGKTVTVLTNKIYYNYIYDNAYAADAAKDNNCGYISSATADYEFKPEPAYEIDSAEKLQEFAGIANTITANVEITAPIDMRDKEWTPIEGYEGVLFDGKNNAISGLSAPLFGTTTASIKNVVLTNVAITEEENAKVGALARRIDSADAVVENCSVAGTMTVDCTAIAAETHIGGLFGEVVSSNKNFSSLTSDVDITIVGKTTQTIMVGGVLSNPSGNLHLVECHNAGKLTVAESAETSTVYMGGIFGYTRHTNAITISLDSCSNSGALSINSKSSGGVRIAGLAGHVANNSTHFVFEVLNGFTNSGAITLSSQSCGSSQIAGFNANHSNNLSETSTGVIRNTGAISYSGTSTGTIRVGGVIAAIAGSLLAKDGLQYVNEGDITITGDAATLTVGGIYGNNNRKMSNARCFCTITAIGKTDASIGMIMPGEPADNIKATNCHIGGSIDKGTKKNDKDPISGEETYIWVADKKDLSAENYFNYLYSVAIEASVAAENGCGYISAIDATPVYATVE